MELETNHTSTKILGQITPFIEEKLFPGCIAGCGTSDRRYVITHGTQDLVDPISTSDLFDIASVTKAMLAALVLKKIPLTELDQKVSHFIPMEGKYRDLITVKDLLIFGVEYGTKSRLSTVTDRQMLIETVTKGDLPSPPGSYRYTNISSMLLTFFMEARFGRSLETMLQEELFDPLGMQNTMFAPLDHGIDRRSIVPTEPKVGRGIVQDESARLYGPNGAAGLFSCIDDLITFGQSFLGPKTFLNKKVIKKMSVSQFKNSALTFGLGMGLWHQNECDLRCENGMPLTVLKKNGFSGLHFCVLPKNNFCFASFTNVCFSTERPALEKRDKVSNFNKNLLHTMYEERDKLFQ